MNNLKTAVRSRLGANLNNLMMWYTMGKELKGADVPVMDILNEFRALAGIRGRNESVGGGRQGAGATGADAWL